MTSKIVVNNIEADAGVSTVTFNSNVVRGDSNLHSTGLALGAGSTVGAVTGVTTYYGDGSQLTGISAGVSLANGVDNRVVTATGAAALNGESTLTYDNPTLEINTDSSYGTLKLDGDAGGLIEFKDDGTRKWELYGATNFSFYDRANTKYGLVLKPGGDVEVSDGNLVIGTSGHGIDFSAAGNTGGMTGELLNDYEEGTWTPEIKGTTGAGTASYNNQVGKYLKIGNWVYLTWVLGWSSGSAGGEMRTTGFPFSPATDCTGMGNVMFNNVSIHSSVSNIATYIGPGNDYCYFYTSRSSAGWITVNYSSSGNLIANVSFRTA